MPHPPSDAARAATRAAAAAAAAAATDGGGGVVPAGVAAGGGAADPPPALGVEGALLRLQQTLDAVSTRLAAVEADREAARDPPPPGPPDLPALPVPGPAAAAADGGVGAGFGLPAADIQSFCATERVSDVAALHQMLQRSRVYLHQIGELCACRYDVLNYDDEEIAVEIQSRILGSADDHASKVLGNVYKEVRADRNKDIVKSLSAAQKKSLRGRRGKAAAAAAAAAGGN